VRSDPNLLTSSAAATAKQGLFAPLQTRNFRLFFGGQLFSQPGTFVQTIAQSWLVLQLTDSGSVLGLVTGTQFAPVLLFAMWGGLLADRFDCRKIMICTQTGSGLTALGLGILDLTGHVHLWSVFCAAAILGSLLAIDSPARQAYVSEMVGSDRIAMAVAFNMMTNNVARVVGPAIAAGLIATAGTGWCFIVNALSFIGVVTALIRIRSEELFPRPRAARARRAVRAGLAHVRAVPILGVTLLMVSFAGALQAGIMVLQPISADRTFHAGAGTYAMFSLSMGAGAVVGGLAFTRRLQPTYAVLTNVALMWALGLVLISIAPNVELTYAAMALLGAVVLIFIVMANAALQTNSDPEMRGRVMALWAVALLGASAVGGPAFGVAADHIGPRWAYAAGAGAALVMASFGLIGAGYARAAKRDDPLLKLNSTGNPGGIR
jgi:MFS family permease